MKKFGLLLVFWMLMGCTAWAQEIHSSDIVTPRMGIAVCAPTETTGTIPMYQDSDEKSGVLMNYFSGTDVEVLSLSENGMAQVRTGQDEVTLTGYMRTQDLRYGANALRAVPYMEAEIEFKRKVEVYSACDTQSRTLNNYYVSGEVDNIIGFNDNWVQIGPSVPSRYLMQKGYDGFAEEYLGGFIKKENVRVGKATEQERWLYLPTDDELTHEQAYERAIDLLVNTKEGQKHLKKYFSEEYRTRGALESLRCDVRLTGGADEICWVVVLETDDANVTVVLTPKGDLVEFTYSNG